MLLAEAAQRKVNDLVPVAVLVISARDPVAELRFCLIWGARFIVELTAAAVDFFVVNNFCSDETNVGGGSGKNDGLLTLMTQTVTLCNVVPAGVAAAGFS